MEGEQVCELLGTVVLVRLKGIARAVGDVKVEEDC